MVVWIDMGVGVGQEYLFGGGVLQVMYQCVVFVCVGLMYCYQVFGLVCLQCIEYLCGVVCGIIVYVDYLCYVGVLQQVG